MFYIEDGRSSFYQWDINRRLVVEDDSITEVHFCNRTDDCSLVCNVYTHDNDYGTIRVVNVPNILLTTDFRIKVYAYDFGYTKHEACFEVIKRTKPSDYVYTETEVKSYDVLAQRLEDVAEEVSTKAEWVHYHDVASFGYEEIKLKDEDLETDTSTVVCYVNSDNSIALIGYCKVKYSGYAKITMKVTDSAEYNLTISINGNELCNGIAHYGDTYTFEGVITDGITIIGNMVQVQFTEFTTDQIVNGTDGFISWQQSKKIDELEASMGDVSAALDNIIAIQEALIGGAE